MKGFSHGWTIKKSVVRVHENREFMEHKTPVACLSDDVITSVGVNYGDNIEVEYLSDENKAAVKCAKMNQSMEDRLTKRPAIFRMIKAQTGAKEERREMSCDCEDESLETCAAIEEECGGLSRTTGSKDEDKLPPIFIDELTRTRLGVEILYPVKIRKKFRWEFWKTINRFGAVSLVAFSVTLGLLGTIAGAGDNLWPRLFGWFWVDVAVTAGLAYGLLMAWYFLQNLGMINTISSVTI